MRTGLYTHEECLGHFPPEGHVEKPKRLEVVLNGLNESEFTKLIWCEAPKVTRKLIELFHSKVYIDFIYNLSFEEGPVQIDADTYLSQGTLNAALRSIGAVCTAVDHVMGRTISNAFLCHKAARASCEKRYGYGFLYF